MKLSQALLLCSLLLAASARAAEPGVLTADVPAAGLDKVTLQIGAGDARVEPSTDGAVHVELDLRQEKKSFLGLVHWMSEATTRDLAGAKLQQLREGNTLTVSLAYPSGESHGDVKQQWRVQVPAGLKLGATMGAGRLVIRGMSGGVSASLEAGDITMHIAGGPVQASVTAGRLHVISDTGQPGKLSLRSMFGLAALSFNGKLYAPPPSSFHFFGNSEHQQGTGKDDMDLKVTFGEVDLRVGPVGEEKDYQGLFDDSDK